MDLSVIQFVTLYKSSRLAPLQYMIKHCTGRGTTVSCYWQGIYYTIVI